jgi:hypothetical protein
MSIKSGIVKGHLRIEADQPFTTGQLWCWNDGKGIHLNKIGVTLAGDLYEAGGNHAELLEELAAQADAETESARLEGEESTMWMCDFSHDGGWILGGNLFDFHSARGGGHDEDATCGAINQRCEIDLANDRGCWRHKDAAHGQAFDREGENRGGSCLGLSGARGKFYPTCLSSSANEDLRLNNNLVNSAREEALGDTARVRGCGGNVGVRDRKAGSPKEFSRFSLVDLHPCLLPFWWPNSAQHTRAGAGRRGYDAP